MTISIKQSRSTDKQIVVVNGRIKIAELNEDKIILTSSITPLTYQKLLMLADKNNLTLQLRLMS